MANGNIEVAKAFVTIVPSMEGSQATITKELTGVTNEASEKAGSEGGAKFGDKFAGALKGAGVAIGAAMTAVTGAAIATGKAFLDSANDVAAYGDQVDKMSQKMGISAQSYQEWDFIMQHAGASIDSLKSSMKILATSAETGSEAFDKLGISQEQIASMSQEDLFAATIAGLQNVADDTERTYLASQLLGRGATELGALFNMSAEETEALRQQVHDLGGVMSDDAVKDAAAYKDSLQNMNTALDGVKRSMMSEFLPGITSVMDGLSKVFSGNGGIEEIQSGLESIISNITSMAPQFFQLASVLVNSLLSGFAPMLPQLVSSIFDFLIQGLTTIVGLIPSLLPVIQTGIQGIMSAVFECLPIIIQSLTQLTMDLVTWLASGNNVQELVSGVMAVISALADSISTALPVLLPALIDIIGQVSAELMSPSNIMTILKAVMEIIGAVCVALVKAIPQIIKSLWEIFLRIGTEFGTFKTENIQKVSEWLTSIVQKIVNFGTNVKNKVTETINSVKNFFSNGFEAIKSKVTNILENIKSKFTSIFDNVKNVVKTSIDYVKNLFNFQWSLPKLKLPHLKVSGSLDLFATPPKIPSVTVEWYRKAMNEPYFLDDPTIFGAANGKLLGGGEAGSELIIGTHKLMEMMQQAVGGKSVVINVYGAEGQDVNALAEVIAEKLENLTRRKGAVYA